MRTRIGTFGPDAKPIYLRLLPDGSLEIVERPTTPLRPLGVVVNIDKESRTITFSVA